MAPLQRVRALMIDDDPDALLLMGLRLNEACGPHVRFILEGAATLREGLSKLSGGDFDVILLDLTLSDSRGLDTVSAVRRKAEGAPIVVLTCIEDEELGLKAIGLGAQDFLIKDRLDIALFTRAVRYAIERSALLRQLRELERLRAEVRERRKSDEFKERLLGAVSHELRSPLTVAQAAVGNLADGLFGPLTKDQKELVDMTRRSLERLGRLVMNALDFSRLDSGRASMEFRRVDARRLIAELVADWRRAHGRLLTLEADLPEALPPVRADPDYLAQALKNLLDNAARHGAGRARVSARAAGDRLRMTVEDDGPGVPRERAESIFTAGALPRPPGADPKGTALGLAICREIAAQSDGRIWLDETAPSGARFHFELPLWTPSPAEAGA